MTEEVEMEQRIQKALRSRLQHFRDTADSLTFEGVRRLLEKDLELDTHALDVHKRYIKQLLEKSLNDTTDENISKDNGEITSEEVKEEEPRKEREMKEDVKELNSHEEEKMEDSPVMGLLAANSSTKSGNLEAQGKKNNKIPSESEVTKAIWKRAAYLKSKSEEITVAGVRRLLEEDLQLEKFSLDPLKKLISKQLDEVLNSPDIRESATPVKKKSSSYSQRKPSKVTSSKEGSDSSENEGDDEGDEEAPKKKVSTKGKLQKSEEVKKRKRPAKEAEVSKKKRSKVSEEASEENTDGGDTSEDDKSRSSARKIVKKKEVLPPAYGKQVEHLKSIIKSCGMSVAPVVYTKAKQLPDNKREEFLIKELEGILAKEGLSADPSEKDIKDVKRRKERAKELEGIDTSNIVLSSRRRSTTTFAALPKPKSPVKKDEDDKEGSDNEDSDDDEDDDDDDDSDSQSEEPLEDDEDSD